MKRTITLTLIIFTHFCYSQQPPGSLRTATFDGEGYELGLQHGKHFKKEIGKLITAWKQDVAAFNKKDADLMIREFLEYGRFEEAIRKWTPELLEEMQGIADGAEVAYRDVLTINLMDEFWVFEMDFTEQHCSGIGIPAGKDHPAMVSQNMDIGSYTDGYQVLMRLTATPNRPEQLILTHPGLIALNGMNAEGVGVCVNTLIWLNSSAAGLPVACVIRGLLNRTGKEEVFDFLESVSHASGQNYLIGIRDSVYDFEASANKVVRYDPENGNGTIYHTNHALANDDLRNFEQMPGELQKDRDQGTRNSTARFNALENRVSTASGITADLFKEALRSKDDNNHPVCVSNDGNGFTFASVIMTLTGTLRMEVAPGPPDKNEYQPFYFESSQKP